jgi:hypothetical protein
LGAAGLACYGGLVTTQLSRLTCVVLGKPTYTFRRKVEWSRVLYKHTFCIKVTMMMMMMMIIIIIMWAGIAQSV